MHYAKCESIVHSTGIREIPLPHHIEGIIPERCFYVNISVWPGSEHLQLFSWSHLLSYFLFTSQVGPGEQDFLFAKLCKDFPENLIVVVVVVVVMTSETLSICKMAVTVVAT